MYRLLNQYRYRKRRKKELSELGLNAHDNVVWLVSYPKSGNSWLRFIIGGALANNKSEELTLQTLWTHFPDSHRHADRDYISHTIKSKRNINEPIFVKSHDIYSPFYKHHKVIYLYRDVFDVIPSYYRYLSARSDQKIDIIKLARGKIKVSHRDWLSHLKSWVTASHPDILFVSYDKLMEAPVRNINKIFKFSGLQTSTSGLEKLLANNSFESLKAREDKYGHKIDGRVDSKEPLAFFSANREPVKLSKLELRKLQAELQKQTKQSEAIFDKAGIEI